MLFCRAYADNGGNGAAAARGSGYSERTAKQQASDLLTKPDVLALVDELLEKRALRHGLTAERIDRERARIALVDVRKLTKADGSVLGLHELDEDTARAIASVKFTAKGYTVAFASKNQALADADTVLGRRKEKLEVTAKLSHEQLVVLAQKLREKRLAAARAGTAAGQGPAAPARGQR